MSLEAAPPEAPDELKIYRTEEEERLETTRSIYVEQEYNTENAERARFLQGMVGAKEVSPTHVAQNQNLEEKGDMLYQWNRRFPRHAGVIDGMLWKQMDETLNIAFRARDEEKIRAIGSFAQALLKPVEYREWDELSEIEKRSVRVAEVTTIMADIYKLGIDMQEGTVDWPGTKVLMEKVKKLASSADVPDGLKNKFLRPAVEKFETVMKERRQPQGTSAAARPRGPVPPFGATAPTPEPAGDVIDMVRGPDGTFIDPTAPTGPSNDQPLAIPGPDTPPAGQ